MHAMVPSALRTALQWTELPDRSPGPGEIQVRVLACGICRTDLLVVDGELPEPAVPIIPGHEIVGRIDVLGTDVRGRHIGERVGIPWLGNTCGICPTVEATTKTSATAPFSPSTRAMADMPRPRSPSPGSPSRPAARVPT